MFIKSGHCTWTKISPKIGSRCLVYVKKINCLIYFQVFNLGDYRRNVEDCYHDHSYFDPNNEKAAQMREQVGQLHILLENYYFDLVSLLLSKAVVGPEKL